VIPTSLDVFSTAVEALASAACRYPDVAVAAVVHLVLLHAMADGVLVGCH
jgi:hypothetical protein